MPSLRERAARLFGGKTEEPPVVDPAEMLFNPLGARIGAGLRIDSPEYFGRELVVRELLQYDFGKNEKVSCYVATDTSDGKGLRLRLQNDGGRMRAVVCSLHDELDEEPGIVGAVNDRGGIFVITRHDKNDAEEKYTRVNDLRVARSARVSRLADANGDGEITPNELESWDAKCWDYSRLTKDEHGVEVREYLFVERTHLKDEPQPRFRLWRGLAVVPDRISLE